MGIMICNYDKTHVILKPLYSGYYCHESYWINKYGKEVIVTKEELFDTMEDMDNWCYDNYSECCRFEIG